MFCAQECSRFPHELCSQIDVYLLVISDSHALICSHGVQTECWSWEWDYQSLIGDIVVLVQSEEHPAKENKFNHNKRTFKSPFFLLKYFIFILKLNLKAAPQKLILYFVSSYFKIYFKEVLNVQNLLMPNPIKKDKEIRIWFFEFSYTTWTKQLWPMCMTCDMWGLHTALNSMLSFSYTDCIHSFPC